MARINLLPHREAKRKLKKQAFIALMAAAGLAGLLIVVGIASILGAQLAGQEARNAFIRAENAKLDEQIKEIANLKQEIEALKARQQAVEDLQGDRNQPVYLLDELVKQVPEGLYLRAFKQDGQRVVLSGYAQTQERVSDFLRNVTNNSEWLQQPEVVEIRSANVGQGREVRKLHEFTLNIGIKRQRDKEAAAHDEGKPGAKPADKAGTGSPAAPATATKAS